MTDLLREAIADAKAVREVALANAKLALEEAFPPRIQSMISSKLAEEAEDDMEMEEGEDMEMEEGEGMEGDSEVEESWNETYGEDGAEEEVHEDFMTEDDEEEVEDEPEMETDSQEVDEPEMEEEPMDEDLMEIIRQLEEELDSSEIGKGDNKKPSSSASDDHTEMKKEKLVQVVNEEEEEEMDGMTEMDDSGEDDIDIQEIINALREEGEEDTFSETEDMESEEPSHEMEEQLQEAYAVIQFLREKLNEVNLLNSKLLFSNKLFRSHSLTESQKMTVIENFDRAGSLREVKLVYATLAESLKGQSSKKPIAPKKSLKESFNRAASKPQASTRPSRQILSESNEVADRFKKLAGLI